MKLKKRGIIILIVFILIVFGLVVYFKSKEKMESLKLEFTKFTEIIEVVQGEKKDLNEYFKGNLDDVKIEIDDRKVDYQKLGEYEIIVTIKDIKGNKISDKAVVKIIQSKEDNLGELKNGLYYVKGILLVNKKHPVPESYVPGEDKTAGEAFKRILLDMQSLELDVGSSYSGYRSYSYQATLYANYVSLNGQEKADTFSARPGYSEHQTGLAFDLKHKDGTLLNKDTEAVWLQENAHKYGFIVRCLEEKESITGYVYEPWHIRYIGSIAEDIYKSGKTLEEYLGVSGGDYE